MNLHRIRMLVMLPFVTVTFPAFCEERDLIIVDDLGGVSALKYYRGLNLQRRDMSPSAAAPTGVLSPAARARYSEADMLPLRSARLTPGNVEHRAIDVPGLTPLFLIGDDDRSRVWLRERLVKLRELRAVGFVVNVSSSDALASLRELAPGLMLAPASGEDLAARLGLHHYPVLITATGIEQ